ncbi:hypothetical protein [Xanthobacter sp. KR7-225]|uniref:hypothetical protein n=1 Tax=Xanthobacter sp. KR7-225 TaxID=3156613 RepID=UPI0032B4B6B3
MAQGVERPGGWSFKDSWRCIAAMLDWSSDTAHAEAVHAPAASSPRSQIGRVPRPGGRLRQTEEWRDVDREGDVRLSRAEGAVA